MAQNAADTATSTGTMSRRRQPPTRQGATDRARHGDRQGRRCWRPEAAARRISATSPQRSLNGAKPVRDHARKERYSGHVAAVARDGWRRGQGGVLVAPGLVEPGSGSAGLGVRGGPAKALNCCVVERVVDLAVVLAVADAPASAEVDADAGRAGRAVGVVARTARLGGVCRVVVDGGLFRKAVVGAAGLTCTPEGGDDLAGGRLGIGPARERRRGSGRAAGRTPAASGDHGDVAEDDVHRSMREDGLHVPRRRRGLRPAISTSRWPGVTGDSLITSVKRQGPGSHRRGRCWSAARRRRCGRCRSR